MVKKYKASITYDTDNNHPDGQNLKGLVFTDVYHINTDIFGGDVRSYISNDLKLVAGGGYDTDHINNVTISITEVQ